MLGWLLAFLLIGGTVGRIYYQQEGEEALQDTQQAVLDIAWALVENAKNSCGEQTNLDAQVCLTLWSTSEAWVTACEAFVKIRFHSRTISEEYRSQIAETIERANNILATNGLSRCL